MTPMKMRSGRAVQPGAKGRSASSIGTQTTTQSSSRLSKGQGTVSVATATIGRDQGAAEGAEAMALPGSSQVCLTTARPNQLTLQESDGATFQGFQSDDEVLEAHQMGNLLGHGPSLAHQVTVKVPLYRNYPVWVRYQQAVEFHMETIFPRKNI